MYESSQIESLDVCYDSTPQRPFQASQFGTTIVVMESVAMLPLSNVLTYQKYVSCKTDSP